MWDVVSDVAGMIAKRLLEGTVQGAAFTVSTRYTKAALDVAERKAGYAFARKSEDEGVSGASGIEDLFSSEREEQIPPKNTEKEIGLMARIRGAVTDAKAAFNEELSS